MQHNQIRQQWLWSCSNFKPHSRPSLSCISSAKSTILMSGIHRRLVLSLKMWISLTTIIYRGQEAAIERAPSHFHPLSFHLSHNRAPKQILQYTESNQSKPTIPANKRIVQKPLSNLHPLSFSEHTVTPHGLQNRKTKTFHPILFTEGIYTMCVFPFRRMLFQCPLI